MAKIHPVQINPIEKDNIVEVKTVSRPQKIENTGFESSWLDENDLSDLDVEETENFDIQEGDEYEEIVFQDDFDKEYRSGTDDNYLEE